MACSSTNSIDSSASPRTPSSARTASARRTQRMVSTGWSACSSATKTSTATSGVSSGRPCGAWPGPAAAS